LVRGVTGGAKATVHFANREIELGYGSMNHVVPARLSIIAGFLLVAAPMAGCTASTGDTSSRSSSTATIAQTGQSVSSLQEQAMEQQRLNISRFEEARAEFLRKYAASAGTSTDDRSAASPPAVATRYAFRPNSPARGEASEKKLVRKASVTSSARVAGNIRINAPWECVPASLKSVINSVAANFGPVVVNSTFRSQRKNRRVGGAKSSYHLRCQAVDFRVVRGGRGVLNYLARFRSVGGLKRYRSGFFHIDTGPRRTWKG
jgi:uncharacterized protein YcbK (DUF882 family)